MKIFLTLISLSIILLLGAIACSAGQSDSGIMLATITPAPTATQSSTTSQANNDSSVSASSSIPQSLADVPARQTYTFRVDPSQTSVEYAVNENLFGNQQSTRGSTSSVQGSFKLSMQDGKPVITLSDLTVDLRTLTSDNNMRDQMIRQQWLQSNQYPTATFVAKSVEGFPSDAVQGKAYTFKVSGDMTIRNITKSVTFDVTVTLNGDTLTGEGTTQIYMKDFGFDPPEILGRFTVTDPATITVKGVANLVES